jgi:hypothetical protein
MHAGRLRACDQRHESDAREWSLPILSDARLMGRIRRANTEIAAGEGQALTKDERWHWSAGSDGEAVLHLVFDEINATPPRLPGDPRPITYPLAPR